MQVSEIMSPQPLTVSPNQTLQEAAELMHRTDCGFLPVGENDRLVGMLTDRDIALRGAGRGKGPETTVRDAMTADVCYCFEDEDIATVGENMGDQRLRRLPVLDRNKRLAGILSLGDIALRGSERDAGEALGQIAQSGGAHS